MLKGDLTRFCKVPWTIYHFIVNEITIQVIEQNCSEKFITKGIRLRNLSEFEFGDADMASRPGCEPD